MGIGIDYGMGTTNRDPATGIRYGVISQNEVLQAWADSSESVYPEPEPKDCETCGGTGQAPGGCGEDCDDCEGSGNAEDDGGFDDFCDPIGFVYNSQGYNASQGSDDSDIFITKSPYYTRARFCSPCAPGACYLMNPDEDGAKAYCFGHDWFEDGKAPYPVYRVDNDAVVNPE